MQHKIDYSRQRKTLRYLTVFRYVDGRTVWILAPRALSHDIGEEFSYGVPEVASPCVYGLRDKEISVLLDQRNLLWTKRQPIGIPVDEEEEYGYWIEESPEFMEALDLCMTSLTPLRGAGIL